MRLRKNITLACLLFLVLSSCSGEGEYAGLNKSGLLDHLPDSTDAVILLPSHEQASRHVFTIFVHFFGENALRELKTKLFRNLKNEIGLDLLSPSSLAENGIAIDQPLAIAGTRKGGIYVSIPLISPENIERFASGFAGPFTNAGRLRMASAKGVQCILSRNRLHILAGGLVAGINASAWTNFAALVEKTEPDMMAIISADNRLVTGGIFPVYAQPGRSLVTINRKKDRLLAEVAGNTLSLDLLAPFRSSLPLTLAPGWALGGQGINPFMAQSDLAGASLVLNLRAIWDQSLRPMVLAQIKRSTKKINNPLTRLLAGGKPLEERIIGMLDVENAILGNLTGRVGFVLRSLKNFSVLSLSPSRIQDSLDGVVVFETPRVASAQAIIKHLAGFSALPTGNQLEITQTDQAGVSIVSFSAPRFRMPDIHLAAAGRFVLLGLSKTGLASFAANGGIRGNSEVLFGQETTKLFTTSLHDISLAISPSALFAAITGTLDAGTRRNLEPFAEQIGKAKLLSFVQFRTAKGTRILGQCIFSGTPAEQDPFADTSQSTDPLLLILGLILILVFLGPLAVILIRRYRQR